METFIFWTSVIVLAAIFIIAIVGIKITASYNFYCWVVSVESPFPINSLPLNLFIGGVEKKVPFCYGFERSWEYGCYKSGSKKFTVELMDTYRMYTFMFLLNNVSAPEKPLKPLKESEVKSIIDNIYVDNGFLELRDIKEDLGLKESTYNPILKGWEILWWTHYKLSNTGEKVRDIEENPEEYAKLICKYPEVMQEFLIEKRGFDTKWK